MSYFTFNIVANAIDAYQQAINVTSDNIANVSTPGASRQSATITQAEPISASPFYAAHIGTPGTRAEGSMVNSIARIHQDSYDTLYRGATSSQYYYNTEQQQLGTLQSNFGEPNNGINTAYAALQTAVSNSTASPTSVSVRQAVLTQAQTFATAVNSAGQAITDQESSVKSQATSVVTQANGFIDQIAALNGQIRALTAVGDNPNTYLDQRDYAIDQLSQILPVSTALQSNGSSFVTVGGRALVDDTVTYHISGPLIEPSANGTPTLVFGLANDPNPSAPAPIPLGSGQLGGFADLYNNKLAPYGQQLDNFASSAATEMNRITQAGVDLNSNVGTPLFTPGNPITAATISVAITDPSQLPLGLISTTAGSIVQPMNSANNNVSTSVPIDGNETLRNPPAAGISGTLSIAVDGTTQTFAYNTSATAVPPGNSDTIADFMTNFNAGHFGVTASYDSSTQTIGFTRDPNNIDAVHRGVQGNNPPTAGFTITDTSPTAVPATLTQPVTGLTVGSNATHLLEALGAAQISNLPQTPLNAYGSADNGDANAMVKLFTQNVGVGALQTTAGTVTSAGPGSVTIAYPTVPTSSPAAFATLSVGQVLTIVDAGTVENVPITAVNRTFGTITVATTAVTAGDPITTTPSQTLGAAYGSLVTEMGLDMTTATTGLATQTALSSSINQARQSVDGINVDEETQNLIKFQAAYTAAAKTFTTLNTMMQTTLGLITGG